MNEVFFLSLRDFLLAAVVAVGFAVLFRTPRSVLWVAGLLGGAGHLLRYLLHFQIGAGIVISTLLAALFIGIAGIYLAHKVHTPPVVFTVPACITMIPGLYAYRTMLGLLKITDLDTARQDADNILLDTVHNFVLASSLLFCLAMGICVGVLLFRQKSAKHITFKLRRRVIRHREKK